MLALALGLGAWTTVDAWRLVGQPYPGFSVMDNLLVGLGVERGGLEPFDLVRAMDGRLLTSGRQIQDEVRRHPPGMTFHYLVNRRGTRSHPVSERWRTINRARSRVRAYCEHPFLVVKRLWGFEKVRYRGLAKNTVRVFAAFALANLYRLRFELGAAGAA